MLHLWYCSIKKVLTAKAEGEISEIKSEKIVEKDELSQEEGNKGGRIKLLATARSQPQPICGLRWMPDCEIEKLWVQEVQHYVMLSPYFSQHKYYKSKIWSYRTR